MDRYAGAHARERHPKGVSVLTTMLAAAIAVLTVLAPAGSVTADPEPTGERLKERVEQLHLEIGQLTEEYNGLRVRLQQARKTAGAARGNLARSEERLEERRQKAALLAGGSYMTGSLDSALLLAFSTNPDGYLDRATMLHELQLSHGEELTELVNAMEAAKRASTLAEAREAEVGSLVDEVEARRAKITALVAKAETRLFREAAEEADSSRGRRTRVDVPIIGSGRAAQAAKWALTQQLKPYVWGAEGPNSYDCSGLVMAAFQTVGINLPHYTGNQWTSGTHISKEELKPGDLVFFYKDLHHVGIYVGGGLMVHAPQSGDVVHVTPIDRRPFAGAVRIAD
ncbi:C40 family peptidase [Rhizohabitans arisaemae]|uniref:C40 family peptidase n=1 Tax=Rhizohabitans arisaemae TaxID=2720610 RepID=UPI0024B0E6DE|nr:C40 family peptidase [Rhizohabitans arisaemae]